MAPEASTHDDANAASHAPPPKKQKQLTGHDVVKLQQDINDAPTVEELSKILKGDVYKQLKSSGPEDVYTQTSNLAKAKHAILSGPLEEEVPAKPF